MPRNLLQEWAPGPESHRLSPARKQSKGIMNKAKLSALIRRLLERSAGHRYYPLVVALIAFISTATFAFPFIAVLVPAVLIAPRRWLVLGLASGAASGLGGGVLVHLFHYLGQEVVLVRFPELLNTGSWQFISDWLDDYGLAALAVVAASPLPQSPAIFLYSLTNPSLPGVIVAIGVGKTVKYFILAWLTARYPARVIGYR